MYPLAGPEPLLTRINVKIHFSVQHTGRSKDANISTFVQTPQHLQMQIYSHTNVLILLDNVS